MCRFTSIAVASSADGGGRRRRRGLLLAAAAVAAFATASSEPALALEDSLQASRVELSADAPVLEAGGPSSPPGVAVRAEAAAAAGVATVPLGRSCAGGLAEHEMLADLARGLKCDPDLIYEYVYNNIVFEPLYGSNKGALGTLLDRRGNDADQARLLVALWKAAGFSGAAETGYANQLLTLSGADAANWLGVPNNAVRIQSLLTTAGMPWQSASANADGTLASIQVLHFIPTLKLKGVWSLFDPSYKLNDVKAGASNLASILGYDRSRFLANAGGSNDGSSTANIDRSRLRSDLTGFAGKLVDYVNTTDRTRTVADVIGGRAIRPLKGSPVRKGWGGTPSLDFPTTCPWQLNPVECRAYVTVTMPGAAPAQSIKLYIDEVYAKRVTISSVASGGQFVPTLLVDGNAPACVAAGTCVNTASATAAGQVWTVGIQAYGVNLGTGSGCAAPYRACHDLHLGAGGSYLLSIGAGGADRGLAEFHKSELAKARAAGDGDSSERVLGEGLAALAATYRAHDGAQQRINNALSSGQRVNAIAVGIVGQTWIQNTGQRGPVVDLPINYRIGGGTLAGGGSVQVGGNGFDAAFLAGALSTGVTSSIFESAVLEETQSPSAGMAAASTIKILDSNMDPAFQGASRVTYFADGTTAQGRDIFKNTIAPALAATYAAEDMSHISAVVNGGGQVLLPRAGNVQIGQWRGAGYLTLTSAPDLLTHGYYITGGQSGGFSGTPISDYSFGSNVAYTLPPVASSPSLPSFLNIQPSPSNSWIADPVDSITGAYIYKADDLTTGGGSFPYALTFRRTYSSAAGSSRGMPDASTGMGNGWTHDFRAKVDIQSAPYAAMGDDTTPAVHAASSIAALYVMRDLLGQAPSARTLTVAAMVGRWFADQMNGNAAMVSQAGTTEEFIAPPRADGATALAFLAPAGSSARLSRSADGGFTYALKDGAAYAFDAQDGLLRDISFPNGMAVSLAYSGQNLTSVRNNLGRSLALTYTGKDVTKVTDDTGRSVSFGYDAARNLTSFTDPSGATTRYGYDTSGNYDTLGRLTQVYYPARPTAAYLTNWYDTQGHVVSQANANGDVGTFFFSGARTEFADALGNRHVTYQNGRGRVLLDAKVLSGTFGNVYGDTVQQNGIVDVATNAYDGLDRLVRSTDPEGAVTTTAYAVDANPWAHNVASVTRTPKPGSPLGSLKTSFGYDANFNKPTSVTSPAGIVTRMTYEAGTGNLTSTVSDAGDGSRLNATSYFTYNAIGLPVRVTDPVGTVTQNTYDGSGNLLSSVRDCCAAGNANARTSYTYSASGDPLTVTDARGNVTSRTWDKSRRPLTLVEPGAQPLTMSYTYDANGNLTQTRQSANGTTLRTTSATYTPTGQVETATDAAGHVTRQTYDAVDRLASVTDPLQRTTTFAYDAVGRPIAQSNPELPARPLVARSYSPNGRLASLTDGNGNGTTYTYDGFDRLATTTWTGGSTETLSYDSAGNVLSRKTRKGDTIRYTYDRLDRVTSKTAPGLATVSYGYDAAGRLLFANDTSPAMTAAAGGGTISTASFGYDGMNRLLTASYGPVPTQLLPSTSLGATFGFGYDATNRRVRETVSDSAWWAYPAGPSGSTAYVPNALNQYGSVGGTALSYDGNGNLVSDGTFTYGYDAENRLVSATKPGTAVSYAYDALGRRKARTVNGVTTVMVQDPQGRAVLDYDGANGAVGNWYAFGAGPNDVLAETDRASTARTSFIADGLGSVIAGVSQAGTVSRNGFQSFGEGAAASGFRYTGARADADAGGIYVFRARTYAPRLGRFLQADPIGYGDGPNMYAYVGNDPLNAVDPTGWAKEGTNGGPKIGSDADLRVATSLAGSGFVGVNSAGARSVIPLYPSLTSMETGKRTEGVAERILVADIASDLEAAGGGVPRYQPTPKGAPQFIFPNGLVLRFDIFPGQYGKQGPHLNLEFPGTGINEHIKVKP